MLKTALALLLALHGLVHVGLAVAPRPGSQPEQIWAFFTTDSWLLTALDGASMRVVGLTLVGMATVSFVLAGVGLLADQSWWRSAAIGAAAVSLVLMVLFWHPYLMLGALLDVAVVAAALLARWPASVLGR